jgi:hypothetical protein
MQKIIKFTEKHDEVIYDASTPELLKKAHLHILRERFEQDGFYTRPSLSWMTDEISELLDVADETASVLPARIQEEIQRAKRLHAANLKEFEEEKIWWSELERVLSLPVEEALNATHVSNRILRNGEFAQREHNAILWLANARRNHEYEGWEIIELSIAE